MVVKIRLSYLSPFACYESGQRFGVETRMWKS